MEAQKSKFSPNALVQILNAEKNVNGASFTLVSNESGKDYTYKISRSEWKGKFYTHIKVETQYLDFKYLGSYFMGKITRKREVVKTPSAIAINWVLNKVVQEKFELLEKSVTLLHLGKCVRCGKTLTDAESIRHGLGAVCRGK